MKKLLFMVCSLAAVVTMAAAPEPDRSKELSQKIEPALKTIEKMLDEIEADFWKNIWEIDRLHNLFESDSLYQPFNGKIVRLVSNCGALQGELYKSGVKMQYPIKQSAVRIQAVWKDLSQLHQRMMKRKDPVTKADVRLDPTCISSIYLTSEIPKNICNYEALLDDLAIINLELFYIDSRSGYIPSGMERGKYDKRFNEDMLISSAGEFFMAVRDLRLTIRDLRRDPFPKPVQNDDPYDLICRIEEDLNHIEREFWDHIYKGGADPGKSNNITRYREFGDRLQNMLANSRNFLNLLRRKKIAYETFNPVLDALTIYDLGKAHDSELRRQMRRFFNQTRGKKDFFVYHFRACDEDAVMLFSQSELVDKPRIVQLGSTSRSSRIQPHAVDRHVESQAISTSRPYRIQPYIPSARLKLLNNPDRIEKLCDSNIAKFQSKEKGFKMLAESAEKYFTAVKKLRLSIWHWKEQFASAESSSDSEEDSTDTPSSDSDSDSSSDSDSENDSADAPSSSDSDSDSDSDSGDKSTDAPSSSDSDSDSGDKSTDAPSSSDSDSGDKSADAPSSDSDSSPDSDSGTDSADAPSSSDSDSDSDSDSGTDSTDTPSSSSESGTDSADAPSSSDSDSNSGTNSADAPSSNSGSSSDSEASSAKLSQLNSEELFQKAIEQLRQRETQAAEGSLMELAKRDYAPAWYLLSQISRNRDSESFEEEVPAPATLLKKAAEAGYVPAVEKWLSTNALESAEEQEEALRFAGRIQAVWRLAEKMESMPQNSRESWLKTIRERAEKGEAACQLLLSYCCMRGNVITFSPTMAREWLQKAAVQDHPEALSLLSGWHPQNKWNELDIAWVDKAIQAGAIPMIAVSTLRRFNIPKPVLTHLEAIGKQGNELAMLALICYYSKRNDVRQLEQWTGELARYRSLQKLGYCPVLPTDSSRFYQKLVNIAQKALAGKK